MTGCATMSLIRNPSAHLPFIRKVGAMKKAAFALFLCLQAGSLFAVDVERKFDRFKNVTTVGIDSVEAPETSLKISSYFVVKGATVTVPHTVQIGVTSKTEDWQYLTSHSLNLIVDGEPMSLGEMSHDGSVGSGYVLEFMWVSIPVAKFRKIANAAKVEAQLFSTEFVFPDEVLKGMKEMAAAIPKAAAKKK